MSVNRAVLVCVIQVPDNVFVQQISTASFVIYGRVMTDCNTFRCAPDFPVSSSSERQTKTWRYDELNCSVVVCVRVKRCILSNGLFSLCLCTKTRLWKNEWWWWYPKILDGNGKFRATKFHQSFKGIIRSAHFFVSFIVKYISSVRREQCSTTGNRTMRLRINWLQCIDHWEDSFFAHV